MVFCAYDYLQYRWRKGKYSAARLEAGGWRLAIAGNFPRANCLPEGSILFAHTFPSIISWAIMYYTSGIASHVAVIRGNGIVFDMTTDGVVNTRVSDYFDGASYLQIYEYTGELQRESVDACYREYEGTPFGWFNLVWRWFRIIMGGDAHFRWKFAADFIIAFMVLSLTAGLFSTILECTIACVGTCYFLIVSFCAFLRWLKRTERLW